MISQPVVEPFTPWDCRHCCSCSSSGRDRRPGQRARQAALGTVAGESTRAGTSPGSEPNPRRRPARWRASGGRSADRTAAKIGYRWPWAPSGVFLRDLFARFGVKRYNCPHLAASVASANSERSGARSGRTSRQRPGFLLDQERPLLPGRGLVVDGGDPARQWRRSPGPPHRIEQANARVAGRRRLRRQRHRGSPHCWTRCGTCEIW